MEFDYHLALSAGVRAASDALRPERLTQEYVSGRIDVDEFEERVYAALKHGGEPIKPVERSHQSLASLDAVLKNAYR